MTDTVAFIGLGIMGGPMARNLASAGFHVQAFDLRSNAIEMAVNSGAKAAKSAGDAVVGAEFVITMLPNSEHVLDVMLGDNKVLEKLDPSSLYIDMSTIAPTVTDQLAEEMNARGFSMIDAPVGRQSSNAEQGTLLIMVGGEDANIDRAMPLFNTMGSDIVHCGAVGSGSRMKIVNNYMSITLNALTAETLNLAEASGLNRELVCSVLLGTVAGQGHLSTTYPAKVLQGDLTPGFPIDLANKDLGLALDFASGLETPVSTGKASKDYYDTASARSFGQNDWTSLYKMMRESDRQPE